MLESNMAAFSIHVVHLQNKWTIFVEYKASDVKASKKHID